jgi:hypothetical protein
MEHPDDRGRQRRFDQLCGHECWWRGALLPAAFAAALTGSGLRTRNEFEPDLKRLQDSNMKTKTLLGTLAIIGLLAVPVGAQIAVSTAVTSGLNEPYNVVEDTNGNAYISDSGNNRIVEVVAATQGASTLAGVSGVAGSNDGPSAGFNPALFSDPQGLLVVNIGGTRGLLVADSGNGLIRFVRFSDGYTVTLAGNTNTPTGAVNAAGANASFNQPIGMDQDTNGNVYIADEMDNAIRVMNLNDPAFGVTNLMFTDGTTFRHPTAVAFVGTNQLWVADSGNNAIKLITLVTPTTGSLTTYMGGNNSRSTGTTDSLFGPNARFNLPSGLLWVNGLGLLISDTLNNSIRLATNNPTPAYGAMNYMVATFAGTPGTAGSANGSALSATLNSPEGLCLDPTFGAFLVADLKNNLIRRVTTGLPPPPPPPPTILSVTTNYETVNLIWSSVTTATNYNVKRSPSSGSETTIASTTSTNYTDTSVADGTTYYYVVSASNAGGEGSNSVEVTATPPLRPVPDPQIGYVTFPPTSTPEPYLSVFVPGSPSGNTFNNDVPIVIEFTGGSSTYYTYSNTPALTNLPAPTSSDHSATWGYVDGLPYSSVVPAYTVAQVLPDLSIKAVGKQYGHPDSAVVSALFQFVVGNPSVYGNNAALFAISNITAGAQMYYTTDGSDPTNDGSGTSIGPIVSGGPPLSLNFGASTNILFKIRGFKANYHPSSIISNDFTTAGFQPNTISFGFASGEASSDFIASPGQTFYAPVTLTTLTGTTMYSLQFNVTVNSAGPSPGPALGGSSGTASFNFVSMLMELVPGTSPPLYVQIPTYMFTGTAFTNLTFTNLNDNLLGVGWLERYGQKFLYDTTKQTLITYSIAHDDMFPSASQPNKVIVGGYSFQVPVNAAPGNTYQIQIGLPSATSDGIGAPGSSVFIAAPTNGSLTGGAINAVKNVTVGQRKYIVGNVYPFRWFNAGDFGNTNLQNADVEQVFESAIYGLDTPPAGSDFFDAMDSCGGTYVDLGHGYLEFNNTINDPNALSALFDGNDTTINQIGFGDGQLDVCDVYVTYRRSLNTNSLVWFQRFWTNGVRVATANFAPVIQASVSGFSNGKILPAISSGNSAAVSITNTPSVNFAAGDYQATAGQQFSIPVTAAVFGSYPLRVLGLKISVVPLDGSPSLATPISFSPTAALGVPYMVASGSNSTYAAVWLDNTIAGISNNASIGTLTVTLPTNATSLSAYAVHFDHASGSPNGIASFPRHTLTGLITLSSRTNSSYGDGIPDSWRLRWFGTTNNLLSVASADADGTGMNNWQKYIAGLDPTDPASKLVAGLDQSMAQSQQDSVIDWPSVSGKQYVIQRSPTLFPAAWTPIYTNSGSGGYMEIHDASGDGNRYYRVSVQ